jgi:hypothetical protein
VGRRIAVILVGVIVVAVLFGAVLVLREDDPPADDPASPAPSSTSTEPGPGIHLSFIQQRFDEGTRRAQLRVINNTRKSVYVERLGLDWAGYPAGLQRADYAVPAGWTIDLRYVLPRPDCQQAAGAAPAYGVITTRRQGRIRQPMPADGLRFLDRLWQSTCNKKLIRRTATVTFAGPWSEEGSGPQSLLHGHLVLTRRSGSTALTLDQVQGSVLFDLSLRAVGGLAADDDRVALPVDIGPGRCDEHARSQSTTTFVFRVWLRVDEGDPLSVIVTPTGEQQARLLAFLDRACGSLTQH